MINDSTLTILHDLANYFAAASLIFLDISIPTFAIPLFVELTENKDLKNRGFRGKKNTEIFHELMEEYTMCRFGYSAYIVGALCFFLCVLMDIFCKFA